MIVKKDLSCKPRISVIDFGLVIIGYNFLFWL